MRAIAASVLAVVDAGPLVAALDRDESDHVPCVQVLEQPGQRLIVPALVVAEVSYLAGTRLGADVEAEFLRGMESLDVEAPAVSDWERMASLVTQYSDLPLGGTDASIVALAERVGAVRIITLDRRHFSLVRPRHVEAFELLPAQPVSGA